MRGYILRPTRRRWGRVNRTRQRREGTMEDYLECALRWMHYLLILFCISLPCMHIVSSSRGGGIGRGELSGWFEASYKYMETKGF